MTNLIPTKADNDIKACLDGHQSFSLIAGAGSGKTTSLITALDYVRDKNGRKLARDDQKVVCITYTKRAVEVISQQLRFDDLYLVSTLHGFLWGEIKRFTPNIKAILLDDIIPKQIAKKEEVSGGNSQRAIAARAKIENLQADIEAIPDLERFKYGESQFSNFSKGEIGHDDVIDIAAALILSNLTIQKIIGQKYPYIFIDEAQDTFENVVCAINEITKNEGLPIVGYFGDPMQQIYDKRAGEFEGPEGSKKITKTENFRSAPEIIKLLNKCRTDVVQFAAGANGDLQGSIKLKLVQAEDPKGERKNTYSEEQLESVSQKFDEILEEWGWEQKQDTKTLFLVRQMIARRQGFYGLNRLFTGEYASTNATDQFQSGTHYLLKPFFQTIIPIVKATQNKDAREILNILRRYGPAFDPVGENTKKSLQEMIDKSTHVTEALLKHWESGTIRQILEYCHDDGIICISQRFDETLNRAPRAEEFNKDEHAQEKSDWLADSFLKMKADQVTAYVSFTENETPFSTQHGVKGEEYENVLVVIDDVEASWSQYNFGKILTPGLLGEAKDTIKKRTEKLMYVCFSRTLNNLNIILFTKDPEKTKEELLKSEMFSEEQISI